MTVPAFTIAFVALGELAYVLAAPDTGIPAIWTPVGVLLAALVRVEPRRWWPYLAIAGTALSASQLGIHDATPAGAASATMMLMVAAGSGAWMLRRLSHGAFTLNRLRDACALIVVSAVAAFAGALPASSWPGWWLAGTLGCLVVGSACIAVSEGHRGWRRLGSWRAVELAAALTGAALLSYALFGGIVPVYMRVPALVLPFLIWPALRFGPLGSSTSIALVCSIGIWQTANGNGPFGPPVTMGDDWLLRVQSATGMATVSFLLLASVAAEREQALAEVKTLRGFIPICAWCHKVRDDAGFWQRLETYLGENTDATFSHSICPSCSDTQHEVAERDAVTPWKI